MHTLSEGRLSGTRCCHVATAIDDIPRGCSMSTVEPTGSEVGAIPIDGPEIGLGIITALHDDGRQMIQSVEVSDTGIVAFATVVVGLLAHDGFPRAVGAGLPRFQATVRIVPDGLQGLTRLAAEDGEELFASGDVSVAVAKVLFVGCDASDGIVNAGVTHVCSCSILGAWCCLDNELCFPVAIHVVNQECRIMGSGTDILSHVDAPKLLADLFAYDFVAVEDCIAGITGLRVVLRIGRIPLDDDLVFAVSIDIAHRAVVGSIGEAAACGAASIGAIEFDLPQGSFGKGLDAGQVFLKHTILVNLQLVSLMFLLVEITGGGAGFDRQCLVVSFTREECNFETDVLCRIGG